MNTSSRTSGMPRWPEKILAKRNTLRRMTLKDAAGWMRVNNAIKKKMPEWDSVPSITYAKNEILHYIEEWDDAKQFIYVIIDNETGKVIGDFHIKNIDYNKMTAEFGHALHPDTWGTGRTYETIRAIHNTAKRRGFTLWCIIEQDNIRSWKSIEKYGARYIGLRRFNKSGSKIPVRKYEL